MVGQVGGCMDKCTVTINTFPISKMISVTEMYGVFKYVLKLLQQFFFKRISHTHVLSTAHAQLAHKLGMMSL